MRLIDADLLGLSDMEIIMCNGDYKEALKMLIDKIEHAPTIEIVYRDTDSFFYRNPGKPEANINKVTYDKLAQMLERMEAE